LIDLLKDIYRSIKFSRTGDRLGPDIPWTHWRLYFKSSMQRLCISKFIRFGRNAEFRPGAYAIGCSKISIGNRVVIRPLTMLFADTRENGAGIVIEDDVMIGSGVHIYVSNHRYSNNSIPLIDQGSSPSMPVVIKRGAWIGANTIILPGVTIGKNTVIGAGSLVTKSIADFSIASGVPAVMRQLNNVD